MIGQLVPGRLEFVEGKKRRVLEQPIDGAYPSIISKADWLAVRALKDGQARNAKGRHAHRPVAHYLAGLASCPLCGSSMSRVFKGSGPKGGRPKLVCSAAKSRAGCQYKAVSIDEVEAALLEGWGNLLANVPADEACVGLTVRRDDLAAAVGVNVDHPRINAALKVLFSRVVVDYRTGDLVFQWRQGGSASIIYSWPD